jgi:hypothetical protein
VLSTIAANHTKGLVATHHDLTSSLIDGYQLAFISGAGAIAVGIGLAFVLLRPRTEAVQLKAADSAVPTNLDMEKQAA